MLLVKTKLGVSKIEGIGLFADENIRKGTIIGKNNDDFGIANYSEKQWNRMKENLSKESFSQIKKYAYKEKTEHITCV